MPSKTQSILLGGLVIALAATIVGFFSFSLPQNAQIFMGCLSCLLYLGSGLLAVWHYTSTHELTIPGGTGASMGALAGIVAGVVGYLIGVSLRAVGIFPTPEEMMERAIQGQDIPPEQMEMMERMMGLSTGIGALLIGVVLGVLLGAIGGAIGAAIFKKGGDTPVESDVL